MSRNDSVSIKCVPHYLSKNILIPSVQKSLAALHFVGERGCPSGTPLQTSHPNDDRDRVRMDASPFRNRKFVLTQLVPPPPPLLPFSHRHLFTSPITKLGDWAYKPLCPARDNRGAFVGPTRDLSQRSIPHNAHCDRPIDWAATLCVVRIIGSERIPFLHYVMVA